MWFSRQRLKYVSHSITTGPRFFSDKQMIISLSFLILLRQVYCNYVRFDFGCKVLLLILSMSLDANIFRFLSISSGAG
jgi:hypothetical protein